MFIAIINQSTRITNDQVNLMSQASQIQFDLMVAPAWNQKSPIVKFYSDVSKIPGYAWVITVMDDPDVSGALGYHIENGDKINGFVFVSPVLDNGGAVLYDDKNPQNVSVSSVLSHEIIEMFGDRFANVWCDGPKIKQGNEYAMELCDPVEGDSYLINVVINGNAVPVSVSNFVFPSWFNSQAKMPENMPYDYMNKLSAPFTMDAGGYMIVRTAGNAQQVFDDKMPHWKKKLKEEKHHRRNKK